MGTETAGLISIIIPVYNTEKYLDRCILSIVQQTYEHLEIILINDGSTDNSLSICRKWEKRDERVRVIDTANRGASAARNIGLRHAAGEYVGFVDSDDEIEEEMYAFLLEKILDVRADICCCTDQYVDMDRNPISCTVMKEGVISNYEFLKAFMELKISGSVCCKLFLSKIIYNNNITFDEDIVFNEDFLFVGKYCKHIDKAVLINKPYYRYYQNEGSVTHTKNGSKAIDMSCIIAAQRLLDYANPMDKELKEIYNCYYAVRIMDVIGQINGADGNKKVTDLRKRMQKELRICIPDILRSPNLKYKYKLLMILAGVNFRLYTLLMHVRDR